MEYDSSFLSFPLEKLFYPLMEGKRRYEIKDYLLKMILVKNYLACQVSVLVFLFIASSVQNVSRHFYFIAQN